MRVYDRQNSLLLVVPEEVPDQGRGQKGYHHKGEYVPQPDSPRQEHDPKGDEVGGGGSQIGLFQGNYGGYGEGEDQKQNLPVPEALYVGKQVGGEEYEGELHELGRLYVYKAEAEPPPCSVDLLSRYEDKDE